MDNPEKKYEEWALWDFLTGLKNRNCYERELEKYVEIERSIIKRYRKKIWNKQKYST